MTRSGDGPSRDGLHLETSEEFDEVVDTVMLEHEIAGFETISVSDLSGMVEGLEELLDGDVDVERTTVVVVCSGEIAKRTLEIDPRLASLLPCATAVYQGEDGSVHVHHESITKAIRDLGYAPEKQSEVDGLVEVTSELMEDVWSNLEEQLDRAGSGS